MQPQYLHPAPQAPAHSPTHPSTAHVPSAHTPRPIPTSPKFPLPQHAATKRCEWIECPGSGDGKNKGHACEETWKWVVKKKVAVCVYCGLQM